MVKPNKLLRKDFLSSFLILVTVLDFLLWHHFSIGAPHWTPPGLHLAQSFLFIGDVDHIAPVTGGAFLLMFACCNIACFVQTVASRTFQPKFRFYSLWTSLLGALLSIVAFFACATICVPKSLFPYRTPQKLTPEIRLQI